MGTKMESSYAKLFVGFIEHHFFSQYHGPKPELYGRYIEDCIGANSSTREELTQFITAVNSFHPAHKYTWEISDTCLAFLDIKISIEGNDLCSSFYYKHIHIVTCCIHLLIHHTSRTPYLFHSFPDFVVYVVTTLIFFEKSEAMSQFFDKRGYPVSVVQAGHHRAQQIDRQSALQTAEKENTDRIPFTLTFHPHNHAVKSIILKNFKLLQNDLETGTIYLQPPLISFKRDKNIGNFLVKSLFQTNDQSGTFTSTSIGRIATFVCCRKYIPQFGELTFHSHVDQN